jgi:hypothetical protein
LERREEERKLKKKLCSRVFFGEKRREKERKLCQNFSPNLLPKLR